MDPKSCISLVHEAMSERSRFKRSAHFSITKPEFVPILVRFNQGDDILRFLVAKSSRFSALINAVRSRVKCSPSAGLFSLIEKENGETVVVNVGSTVGELASTYQHDDGFLYVSIRLESIFG